MHLCYAIIVNLSKHFSELTINIEHLKNLSGVYNIVFIQTYVLLKYIFKYGNHKIKI